jgi:DinB superfamily
MPLSSSLLSRLKNQHETIRELIKGIPESTLRQRINPEKWSAYEQIAHLTAYQPCFIQRMQWIVQKESPLFERYLADNDPLFHDCVRTSLQTLLEDLDTRRFLIHKHITGLSETALRKEGIHPLYGRFSIGQWTEFFLLHEAHHLFSIFMLTAAIRNTVQH